jgi:hypothetical protein
MRKLCFTERSLQFSKIAHKSLGELHFPFSSVSLLSGTFFFPTAGVFSLALSLSTPVPFSLSLSPSCGSRQSGSRGACAGRRPGVRGPWREPARRLGRGSRRSAGGARAQACVRGASGLGMARGARLAGRRA